MDKEQAKRIIKDTFETSFNEEKFISFIMNLLNLKQSDIENTSFGIRQGYNIPEMFRPYISRFQRIAKYLKDDNRIDVLIVYLKKENSIERARSRQRNFIAGYLKGNYGSDKSKDAALVAFVSPNEADWRFSLVKMDYRFEEGKSGKIKVREEFTPVRRWSFLVGKNESSHTAQSRLVHILSDDQYNPTLTQLEEAFNIEKVTKEFFLKYRNLFLRIKEGLDKVVEDDPKVKKDFAEKGVDTVNFAKKFLGQIVFLYFLQKKGWFGVERDGEWRTGPKDFLRQLFNKEYGNYKNFFNDILEPLFYEALARERDDDFYSRFNCKIPFLNGGLFEPIGGYDWVHTDINLSNTLFSNRNDNYEGNGVFDIFDLFNFTVKEDEPLEKEVAIDPELLGKTYEKFNAIRPDNYEEYKKALKSGSKGEENKFNKKFGIYYTPREIVHYMCQESLINYLHTVVNQELMKQSVRASRQIKLIGPEEPEQLGFHTDKEIVDKKAIEELIKYGEQFTENEQVVEEKKKETKTYKYQLLPGIRKNAKVIDEKLKDIRVCDPAVGSGAFPVGTMHEIIKIRSVLSVFINEPGRTPYNFKRECIEDSLYGVDIDPGAVEIAKLRLWLSLIVDEEDIKNIKPLPNLDYKIVCGNSLLGFPETWGSPIEKEIESLMDGYFSITNPEKKRALKTKIDKKIKSRYTNSEKIFGYKINFDFKTVFSKVFRGKGGFDIVIANPPYVSHVSFPQLEKKALADIYTTFKKRADLYVVFYEKGVQLLKYQGVLTYISPNKFFRSGYGAHLRNFLNKETKLHTLVDFGDTSIFETTTYPCIVILRREKHGKYEINYADMRNTKDLSNRGMFRPLNSNVLSFNIWSFAEEDFQQLKEKMKNNSVSLAEYIKGNFYRGVVTGLNRAFIITEEVKQNLLTKNPKISSIVKPYLMGRSVKRWYSKQTMYILYAFHGIEIGKYPEVLDYLMPYKSLLEKRATSKNHKWYELQQPQIGIFHYFERPKIISTDIAKRCEFTFDNSDSYIDATLFCLPIDDKYLLALLNSRLLEAYYKSISSTIRGGFLRFKKIYIEQLPVKITTESKRKLFIDLIDKILAITRDEDYLQNQQKQTKVKTLEQEIDQMVYQLYGLTDDEIKIMEKNN